MAQQREQNRCLWRVFTLIGVALAASACAMTPQIKTEPDAVSFPARIVKAGRVDRESSGNYMASVSAGGAILFIPAGFTTSTTHSEMMYTLAIPNHEPVEVDAAGDFSVGQCVILHVRSRNADNTRFFPASGQLEPYDRCSP